MIRLKFQILVFLLFFGIPGCWGAGTVLVMESFDNDEDKIIIGAPPQAFTLIGPADGSTVLSLRPTFTWNDAIQEEYYILQIDSDAGFTNPIDYSSTPITANQTSYTLPLGILNNATSYYWRITAVNNLGETITSTAPPQFTSLDTAWAKTYGTLLFEDPIALKRASTGGYLTAGVFIDSSGLEDILVVHVHPDSTLKFSKLIGITSEDESPGGLDVIPGGGSIVAGSTAAFGAGTNDAWLVRLSDSGDIIWQKHYGGALGEGFHGVQLTSDGGFVAVGFTLSFGADAGAWVVKTDSIGNLEWTHTYNVGGSWVWKAVTETSDGGFVLVGSLGSNVWVMKLDATGSNILWEREFGGGLNDDGKSVFQDENGDIVIGADSESYGDVFWILKLRNSDGTVIWQQSYEGGKSLFATLPNSDGGFLISGGTNTFGVPVFSNSYVIRTLVDGSVDWAHTYNAQGNAVGTVEAPEGGYMISVTQSLYGAGQQDIWMLKTDVNGIVQLPTIGEAHNPITADPGDLGTPTSAAVGTPVPTVGNTTVISGRNLIINQQSP